METLPMVSAIVDTYEWSTNHRIQLWDTLQALASQSYPRGRLEILVVLVGRHHHRAAEIRERFPEVKIIEASPQTTEFAGKDLGARSARGEILAMTEADTVPNDIWIEEAVRSLMQGGTQVAAVQGQTRFQEGPLSKMMDAIWWARAFEEEGPIDRIYAHNNLAVRSEIYRQHRFSQDDALHTGPERIFGDQLRRAGFEIWLNPRMVALHVYQPSLREWVQMGIVRGYYFIAVRHRYSYPEDRLIRSLGWLAPLAIAPLLWVKDVFRLLRHAPRLGLAKWEYLKLPAYALAYLWLDLVVMVGMYQSLADRPLPRLPFANPSPPPAYPSSAG